MDRAHASGGRVVPTAPTAPTLAEALKKTITALDENRPWYEALVLRKQAAEAYAGETASRVMTTQIIDGFSFVVNMVNEGLLRPVCVGLEELFAAVKGATAAREELIDLLSYCVSITSIVLNQALLADLPEHIKKALRHVEAEIKAINGSARLFDTKTGCSLPCRRLRRHAKDREEIKHHKIQLVEILDLATQATVFDTNTIARQTQADVASMLQGPPTPGMARIPKAALPLPRCYVTRTSLLDDVIKLTMAADNLGAPRVLFGMGGSGKTVLASAVVSDDRIRKHFRRGVFWIKVGRDYNLVSLLERLALRVVVDPAGPIEFNTEEEGIQRLTTWIAKDPRPRLLVLDDVWDSEVVNALRNTGLALLITTRFGDVVGEERGCTEVGDLTKPEARDLLQKQSGAVNLPEAEGNKVAEECGWLALALAIAGSLPIITRSPDDAKAWRSLHVIITEKKRQRRGLMMAAGIAPDKSQPVLFSVLDLGMDQLGEDARNLFFNLVVLARGVPAPVGMLTNLWEQKDDFGTIKEADFLAGRSMLRKAHEDGYILHDLMLDFVRMECDRKELETLVKGAVERQRQYLGRLAVLQRYSDVGEHLHTGVYALISLWRSLEELSGNGLFGVDRLAETYMASLNKIADTETENAGRAYFVVASFFELTGRYPEAVPLYEWCQAIQEKTLGPEHPELAVTLNKRARLLQSQGKYSEAEQLYKRCQAIQEKALDPEHPNLANTLRNRATLFVEQGKYSEADPLYERCQEIQEKTLGPEHPDLAITLNKRATLLQIQGKYSEADLLYERCQVIQEKALDPEHPDLAVTLGDRAKLLQSQGKYSEAEPLIEKCQGIQEKVLGREHPDVAMTLCDRAALSQSQGKYREADRLFQRCQMILEALDPDHPGLATVLNNHATLLERQGWFSKAEQLHERSLAIVEKKFGSEHPDFATMLNNRAQQLERQGKYSEAEPLYERCQPILEKTLGPEHPVFAKTLNNRAVFFQNQGKYSEAEPLYERCQAIQEKTLGPEHPDLAITLRNRATLLMAQGKLSEAKPFYERSQAIQEKALGSEHPDLVNTLKERAAILQSQGKLSEAEPLRCQALQGKDMGTVRPSFTDTLLNRLMWLQSQGKLAEALTNQAGLLERQERYSEAVQLFERAVSIRKASFGESHEDTIKTEESLVHTRRKAGILTDGDHN